MIVLLIDRCYTIGEFINLEAISFISTWMQSLKNNRAHRLFPGQTIHDDRIVYALTGNAEDAEEERLYEDLQDPSRTGTFPKGVLFYYIEQCKSRKSRNTLG